MSKNSRLIFSVSVLKGDLVFLGSLSNSSQSQLTEQRKSICVSGSFVFSTDIFLWQLQCNDSAIPSRNNASRKVYRHIGSFLISYTCFVAINTTSPVHCDSVYTTLSLFFPKMISAKYSQHPRTSRQFTKFN